MDSINQSRLDVITQRHGDGWLIRQFEINFPTNAEEFVSRLYAEIKRIVEHLESTAHDKQDDGEDKLTRYVVGLLNQTGYQATHDQDQKGHTDLIVCSGDYKWLSEAKRHSDYDWLFHGLQQLQTYATGREAGYGLLIYIFNQNASAVMDEWRRRLTQSENNHTKCIKDGDGNESLTFWSIHEHQASGTDMNTKHIGVSLYCQPRPLRD